MSSLNKVILIGNVGKAPEIRSFQSGGRVANFTLATSESWKSKDNGERVTKTEWHNISITNDALVGIVERFVQKGSKVYVEGQLQTRKWQDNSGSDRYSTEVVLKPYHGEIVLLDSKNESQNAPAEKDEGAFNKGSSFADDLDDLPPF